MKSVSKNKAIVIFEDNNIRRHWDERKELWFFSVIDIVKALTGSSIPRRYWSDLKNKLKNEGSEVYEKIVQLKNSDVWLLDTKKGQTAESAKERAEGLAKYIKEQNKKSKKLFGGIVIPKNKQWWYNNSEKYEYNPNDLRDWKFLDL